MYLVSTVILIVFSIPTGFVTKIGDILGSPLSNIFGIIVAVLPLLSYITIVYVAIKLAGELKHSKFSWGIVSIIMPWVAGLIIPFMGEAKPKPSRAATINRRPSSPRMANSFGDNLVSTMDKISYTTDSCKNCGSEFSWTEGIKFAATIGITNGTVACPQCQAIYRPEVVSGRMSLGDEIPK
jgi:hypothetical protein